jgi:N-formylglutamate amidohydrolase
MAAFEVVGGDDVSPVVLHVPHASTSIPDDVRARILLDDDSLAAELRAMTDAHTDRIASMAATMCEPRPWSFVNRASRLVVDPERFTDPELEEMAAIGMGAVYAATHDLARLREPDAAHEADLLDRFFHPYAEALADLVDRRLVACGRAVVIDVHSYPTGVLPYERHPDASRPPVCLGIDADHTPAWLEEAARAAFAGWDLAINEPFAGTYVPTRHYGRDLRVSSLMVEIRRDQYLDAAGDPVPDGIIALGEAVAALAQAASSS